MPIERYKTIGRSSKGNMECEADGLSSNSKGKNDWGEEAREDGEKPQFQVLEVLSKPGIGTAPVRIDFDGRFGHLNSSSSKGGMESNANGLSSNSKGKADWGEEAREDGEGPPPQVLEVLSRPGIGIIGKKCHDFFNNKKSNQK